MAPGDSGRPRKQNIPPKLCTSVAALVAQRALQGDSVPPPFRTRPRRRGAKGLDPILLAAVGKQPRGRTAPLIPEHPVSPGQETGVCAAGKNEWTPRTFTQQALRVTHPFDDPVTLGPNLSEAVEWWTPALPPTLPPTQTRLAVMEMFPSVVTVTCQSLAMATGTPR